MRARLRHVLGGGADVGISLTELVVVMMVTSLVLTLMGGFFINIVGAVTVAQKSREGVGSASNALDEVAKVVRSGAAIQTATDPIPAVGVGSTGTAMTVISYADADSALPAPAMVTFSLNAAGDLVEQRVAGVNTSGYWAFTGTTTRRTFTGPFSSAAGFFVYRDAGGTQIAPTSAALAVRVTQVEVTFTVPHQGRGGDDPVTVTTTALMPNLGLS